MTSQQIAVLFMALFHWALPAGVPEAFERTFAAYGGDPATVLAVCTQESAMARRGRFLCGVLPFSKAPTLDDQARFAARAFPRGATPRRARRRLALWRCGPSERCLATEGALYARRVWGLRARIQRVMRETEAHPGTLSGR